MNTKKLVEFKRIIYEKNNINKLECLWLSFVGYESEVNTKMNLIPQSSTF